MSQLTDVAPYISGCSCAFGQTLHLQSSSHCSSLGAVGWLVTCSCMSCTVLAVYSSVLLILAVVSPAWGADNNFATHQLVHITCQDVVPTSLLHPSVPRCCRTSISELSLHRWFIGSTWAMLFVIGGLLVLMYNLYPDRGLESWEKRWGCKHKNLWLQEDSGVWLLEVVRVAQRRRRT